MIQDKLVTDIAIHRSIGAAEIVDVLHIVVGDIVRPIRNTVAQGFAPGVVRVKDQPVKVFLIERDLERVITRSGAATGEVRCAYAWRGSNRTPREKLIGKSGDPEMIGVVPDI